MRTFRQVTEILFPFAAPPAFGKPFEIAPGISWMRLPLPFRLNHVNIYLLEDEAGWSIVDTGVDDAPTRAFWMEVLDKALHGKPVRRVIVTHYHPDHVGAAAFLCERTGARLEMGETEYLTARVHLSASAADVAAEQGFYRRHGLSPAQLASMARRLERYRCIVPALPTRYVPLRAGERLKIAGRCFDVHCFAGHSPAQILLHASDDGILIAADHILSQISPNVSVAEGNPEDDPLGLYLESFGHIRSAIPDSVLVLPGHRLPFRGLHLRLDQLATHHAERCAVILEACRPGLPLSAADMVPVLFPMELDPLQLWFGFSEALAHVNYLARRGQLVGIAGRDGVLRWESDRASPALRVSSWAGAGRKRHHGI